METREGFASLPTALPPGALGAQHEGMHGPGGAMMGRGPRAAMMAGDQPVLRTEVQLRDGRWARFDAELPGGTRRAALAPGARRSPCSWRRCCCCRTVAVRWVVRPLHLLAEAADALGQDLERAPLPEDGPREVRQAARAFNTMQRRLSSFINDRTRVLTALSHDLKTPLTRLRLRAELLDDDAQRERFEADLREMEAMVVQTLEFMRGLGHNAPRAPVDVRPLLATLQADNAAMGRTLRIEGRADAPLVAEASLLKRALGNLVDNACAYGGSATLQVRDSADELELRVLRRRPGHSTGATRAGLRALLPARGLAQPSHRRDRPGPRHRAQHRAQPRRGPGAAQPPGRRAGGGAELAAARHRTGMT